MRILVLTVPHENQRYSTAGDWYESSGHGPFPPGSMVTVSDTGDKDSNLLIALHEIFEMHLCKRDGVPQAAVDDFDVKFEDARARGECEGEPGDAAGCPYKQQHRQADLLERFAAELLGVDWGEHEKKIDKLGGEK
jgi:hypothetical protein